METQQPNASRRPAHGLTPLAAAVFSAALLVPNAARAADAVPEPQASPVVVTATRTAKTLDEAPSSVSLVTSDDIDRNQYGTIGDVFEDIPNIDV